ncbi:hypothetical protein K0M31_020122 [Melipona bicolor]|uniref:Uncharacterized protein n=1 Tax=Melipona bicolor TaxID=60889 RepID=A0AA40G1J4_9HYME|nr:hypothetical protein K0M31_020122 [Melipona bicolor]
MDWSRVNSRIQRVNSGILSKLFLAEARLQAECRIKSYDYKGYRGFVTLTRAEVYLTIPKSRSSKSRDPGKMQDTCLHLEARDFDIPLDYLGRFLTRSRSKILSQRDLQFDLWLSGKAIVINFSHPL